MKRKKNAFGNVQRFNGKLRDEVMRITIIRVVRERR